MNKKDDSVSHYKVLQIDDFSPLETVRAAYKKMALQTHPDKQVDGNAEDFLAVEASYKYLVSNKTEYDVLLSQSSVSELRDKINIVEDFDVCLKGDNS